MTIAISFVLPIQPKSKKHINWSAYSANIKKYISMMTNARKITVGLLLQLIFYYPLAKNGADAPLHPLHDASCSIT